MKRLFTLCAIVVAVVVSSCSKFDDTDIWDKLNDHESRITALEELCKQMNTNITALQTIIEALEKNDYITNVSPVRKDGEIIGYTITFAHSDTITIYHGENGRDGADGKDGYTPQIGVMKDTDGIYYWTLDGEWLLDGKGNKIQANGVNGIDGTNGINGQDGTNGVDGITPRLKIDNDYWYVSYDEGATWIELGKATGENGSNGIDGVDGDSIFSSVTQDDEYVYFNLANGSVISIEIKNRTLDIFFDNLDEIAIIAGGSYTINYSINSLESNIHIAIIAQNGWEASLTKISEKSGFIKVQVPNPIIYEPIIVFVSDTNTTIMKCLTFMEGVVSIEAQSYHLTKDSTTLEVNVSTNLNYTINIPYPARSWISLQNITSRASMRDDIIYLHIEENATTSCRVADVELICDNIVVGKICIIQQCYNETDIPRNVYATIDFDNLANRTYFSTDRQVWVQNGIVVTQNKYISTSNIGDYYSPIRLYKGTDLTVAVREGQISSIVFHCNNYKDTYVTGIQNSTTCVTTIDGYDATVTLDTPAQSFVIESMAEQVRIDAITVYYTE